MPPFISKEDARQIDRASRAPTAFGGSRASRATPEAAAAWQRAVDAYTAAGGAPAPTGRSGLGDQSRTEAFDPWLDRNDPRNVNIVDYSGRVNPAQGPTMPGGAAPAFQQPDGGAPPAPKPTTQLSSRSAMRDRVTSILQGLPSAPAPTAVNAADFAYPAGVPGRLVDEQTPQLPPYQRPAGMPAGTYAPYRPEELTGPGGPSSGAAPVTAGVSDLNRNVAKIAALFASMGVPREQLSSAVTEFLRAQMPKGGATFGGNKFGGNTFGGNTFGGNTFGGNKFGRSAYAGGGSAIGKDVGGFAGNLIGSIWGPIGGMVGKKIGSDVGSGIGTLIETGDLGKGFGALLEAGPLGSLAKGDVSGFMDPLGVSGGSGGGGFLSGLMGGGGGGGLGGLLGGSGFMFKHGGRAGYPQLRTAPVRTAFSTGGGNNYVDGDGMGDGRSDHIDAVLSPGEYVMDAETVSMMGDGDNEAGARAFDGLRRNIRKHKGAKLAKGDISAPAKRPEQYLAKGGRAMKPTVPKVAEVKSPTAPKITLSAADRLAHAGPRDTMRSGPSSWSVV